MKTSRYLAIFLVIMLILSMLTSCGAESDSAASDKAANIYGSWAYSHDKEKAIVIFCKDGSAQYEGKDYSYEYDSEFIKLKAGSGETIQLRYALNKGGMYLYSNTEYTYDSEGVPVDLVGEWVCQEKNWSYSFTDKGTFLEDGYFPGYYTVDEANSTLKLVYNDQFEDTICYFRLEGDKLYIEYPWPMVKMSSK